MQSILSRLPKFVLNTAPSGSVVTVEEAKIFLKQPDTLEEDDALIQGLLDAAVSLAEAYTNRRLLTQTWDLYFDGFPPYRRLEMPLVPFQSLSLVEYLQNTTGNWAPLDPTVYDTDDKTLVPAIMLQSLVPMWPLTKYLAINSVHLRVVCGYVNAAAVPAAIKQAILRMVATWYDNRADIVQGVSVAQVPMVAERLLDPYKVYIF